MHRNSDSTSPPGRRPLRASQTDSGMDLLEELADADRRVPEGIPDPGRARPERQRAQGMDDADRRRVALVTGGSRGIGLAVARALALAGRDVAITGRDPARAAAAVA